MRFSLERERRVELRVERIFLCLLLDCYIDHSTFRCQLFLTRFSKTLVHQYSFSAYGIGQVFQARMNNICCTFKLKLRSWNILKFFLASNYLLKSWPTISGSRFSTINCAKENGYVWSVLWTNKLKVVNLAWLCYPMYQQYNSTVSNFDSTPKRKGSLEGYLRLPRCLPNIEPYKWLGQIYSWTILLGIPLTPSQLSHIAREI